MWDYGKNKQNKYFQVTVPLLDGTNMSIEHLSVSDSQETLGVPTCPNGNEEGKLKSMHNKAQEWTDQAKEGHPRQRDIWFLMEHQLWPKVGYGLFSLSLPWQELDGCLRRQWWQIGPMGGLIRSAPHQI